MRKFQRASTPEVLVEHGARWTQQWLDLLAKNSKAKFAWYELNGQTARDLLLPFLELQTTGHCSFCDGIVEGISRKTIEHFRPKNAKSFPALAYAWSNLYFCCDACQSFKLEEWDELLLNPDAEDYACSRYFEFDLTNGEMKPKSTASEADQERAKKTIELYGLDDQSRRRRRLLELRRQSRSMITTSEDELWAYHDFLGIDG
ncbi:MAG: retron system putative HNH endonuclease [Fimbriiglobus sp.]